MGAKEVKFSVEAREKMLRAKEGYDWCWKKSGLAVRAAFSRNLKWSRPALYPNPQPQRGTSRVGRPHRAPTWINPTQ